MARRMLHVLAVLAALSPAAASADETKPKVISLNDCLDEVVLEVADSDQILALSHYARDPHSSIITEAAKKFPVVYETAEEIVALRPDLVLGSFHSSPETRAALIRLGIQTVVFKVPITVEQSYENIRQVAKLLGHPDRGEKLIERIEAALVDAAPPAGAMPIPALVYEPYGFSPGKNELVDEMLRRTGFSNVAADRYGRKGYSNIPLELVINDPPRVLLSLEAKEGAVSWAERVSSHPALKHLPNLKRALLPRSLIVCGGPTLIPSAMALATARKMIMESAP